jgi:hypothetical protein
MDVLFSLKYLLQQIYLIFPSYLELEITYLILKETYYVSKKIRIQ